MKLKKLLSIFFIGMFSTYSVFAQNVGAISSKTINQKAASLFIQGAIGLDEIPSFARYNAILIGGGYSFPLYQARRISNISLDIMPHGGFGQAVDGEYEFGLNIQAGLNFQLNELSVLSFKLGTGPHYISFDSDKQSSGFVFSDNASLVYRRLLKNKGYDIGFKAGLRHLSNLSIRNPNGGLNSFTVGVVIRKLLPARNSK